MIRKHEYKTKNEAMLYTLSLGANLKELNRNFIVGILCHPEFKILNKIDFIKLGLSTTSSRKNESYPHLSIKKVSNKKLLYHLFHFA